MKQKSNISLQDRIERVRRMEIYFDRLRTASEKDRLCANWDCSAQKMLRELAEYFENGQWLEDYTCDEQGVFPPELKRGVLSQDGLYNFLCGIK